MRNQRQFTVEATFNNEARLRWTLEAGSYVLAQSTAWWVIARLIEDGNPEVRSVVVEPV